jgi:hypothetical protein
MRTLINAHHIMIRPTQSLPRIILKHRTGTTQSTQDLERASTASTASTATLAPPEVGLEEVEEDLTEVEEGLPATHLVAAGTCIPHPAKVAKGGEDAFFILEDRALGVADGVGGWTRGGIDPGEYSRQLMEMSAEALRKRRSRSCVEALRYAHNRVEVPGSSTAIIAKCGFQLLVTFRNRMNPGGRLESAIPCCRGWETWTWPTRLMCFIAMIHLGMSQVGLHVSKHTFIVASGVYSVHGFVTMSAHNVNVLAYHNA